MSFKYVMGNNIYYQFLNAYYVSFAILDTLHTLPHLALTNLIQDYPNFIYDNVGPERLWNTSKDMQLINVAIEFHLSFVAYMPCALSAMLSTMLVKRFILLYLHVFYIWQVSYL